MIQSSPVTSDFKKTALYDLHLALAAKMTEFAGYFMPLHYPPGIIAEHLHCRGQAGFFDISHMGQCLVQGEDASDLLAALVPSNLETLTSGRQLYTVFTNSDGGIIDDLIVARLADGFMLVVNAACKDKDFAYLKKHLGKRLQVLPQQSLVALQGPVSASIIRRLAPAASELSFMQNCRTAIDGIDCLISRSGYTGEDGFEISLDDRHARQITDALLSFEEVRPVGLGARDTLRLEAGLSLYGHELSEDITPIEAGLNWIVDKRKQQFPGAKIIHEQLAHSAPRKRVALKVESKIPLREHTEIFDLHGKTVGIVTSGSYSPTLNQPIALSLIESHCNEQHFYSVVRNRRIELRTTPLPFVPHRYYRG